MKTIAPLTRRQVHILLALDTRAGTTTGRVADKVRPMFGSNKHQHSGAVRAWLLELEKAGLVRRLDDQKPVCWVKVSGLTPMNAASPKEPNPDFVHPSGLSTPGVHSDGEASS